MSDFRPLWGGNGYRDTEISLTQLSTSYMVLISSLIWLGVGGSSPQIISNTIFCVDELPNGERLRFLPHAYDDKIDSFWCCQGQMM